GHARSAQPRPSRSSRGGVPSSATTAFSTATASSGPSASNAAASRPRSARACSTSSSPTDSASRSYPCHSSHRRSQRRLSSSGGRPYSPHQLTTPPPIPPPSPPSSPTPL